MNPDRRPSEEDQQRPDPESHPQPSNDAAAAAPAPEATTALRTFVSRSSLHAPSFHATEDPSTEAFPFPTLPTDRSSQRRRSSNASQYRPNLDRSPSRNPSIRIRRRSNVSLRAPSHSGSVSGSVHETTNNAQPATLVVPQVVTGRARSASQPERVSIRTDVGPLARHSRAVPQTAMPRLTEEGTRPTMEDLGFDRTPPLERPPSPAASLPELQSERNPPQLGRMRKMSRFFWPVGRHDGHPQQDGPIDERNAEYDDELVDFLDVVDPEVQTLSTLTNIQNSLFIPDLGHWVNRRPTYVLSDLPRPVEDEEARIAAAEREKEAPASEAMLIRPTMERTTTISSRLTDSHYAALPHGTTLEGWSAADKWELDDHVRHMLHSRRSKFKRRMKGFGQYVRRPLGFAVTLYATLITLFGLAWVLFLIGWIYVGEKQVYAIHIIDSVLVALFAIVGDGLAPFRAIDTYRMIYIWRYTRIIENAKKGKLPKQRCKLKRKSMPPEDREALDRWHSIDMSRAPTEVPIATPMPAHIRSSEDIAPDEIPEISTNPTQSSTTDVDVPSADPDDAGNLTDEQADPLWPLTPAQQKKLQHHQKKLSRSHSFYKPHETGTHFAFPLAYLIAIVILLDCHSCLQISLGATTWGIDYRHRPIAITTVILCVSIACNISAGLVITVGDRKTRKKDVHALMSRQELTGDAIKKIEERKKKESKEKLESAGSSRKTSKEFGRRVSPRMGKLSKERSERSERSE